MTPAPSLDASPTGVATPVGDDPTVLIGHVIAERFRVDAVLGIGGMGAVLRCHHLGLRRDVAVKLLHPELANDREIAARFEREAASASRLDHPNCVRVLDFGVWQPVPGAPAAKYLAMQLLEGQELTKLLGRPIAPRRAVALMQQILAGLEHAHAHGVVHRDLKPENVFVTRDHDGAEQLKLVDFGIAKISEGPEVGPKLTRVGVVFGTPRYMSPEQAAGGVVDARTDLYAAGVILFEMLAGMPPFDGDDAITLLRKHLFEEPPTLSDALPPGLRAIVSRLLAKDRGDRFANATEIRTALSAIEAQLDAPAAPAIGTDATLHRVSTMAPGTTRGTAMALPLVTAPAARPAAGGSRTLWLFGGGAAAVVLVIAAWPRTPEPDPAATAAAAWATRLLDDAPTTAGAPAPMSVAGAPIDAASPAPGLTALLPLPSAGPSAAMLEIDAALARGEASAALGKIDAALGAAPDDAALHLRRGRALATMAGRDNDALAAFADALQLDGTVLDDRDAHAELFALLRRPAIRARAAEFAIESLDEHGLPLLVEFVQAPKPVLDYGPRHRALGRIDRDPEQRARVDPSLQRSLDLWQAGQAAAPCVAFATALDAIEREPTAGVLGTLHRVTPPGAPAGADLETATGCATLPVRLQTVRAAVLAAHPVPADQWTVPPAFAAPKKKKRRRGLRGLFGG